MIKVIKDFYKLSEKKSYYVGDEAEFDADTEARLISEGLLEDCTEKKVLKEKPLVKKQVKRVKK
tara:strand:- start:408 stop:599 length:192 start_codon:yes stop_codon:yes gene_type:complete